MIMPAVRLEGPMAAANFYNVTFSRITANPVPEEADDSTLVADPLPTNQVFGDSQAAANISIPIKPSSTAAVGLFITDRDALFEQLQRVRLLGVLGIHRRATKSRPPASGLALPACGKFDLSK